MSSVFRIATMQAIKEIVEENSVAGRFGLIVTEENIEEISKKVVDLFEMTLALRTKTQEIFGGSFNAQENDGHKREQSVSSQRALKKQSNNRFDFSEDSPFPKSKNAAEVYDFQSMNTRSQQTDTPLTHNLDLKLPRKRYELTLEERDRMIRR